MAKSSGKMRREQARVKGALVLKTPSLAATPSVTQTIPEKPATKSQEVYSSDEVSEDEEESMPFKPFPFLDLPAELRLRVYEEILRVKEPLDLHPQNYRIARRLTIFHVCRQVHEEAYRVFYAQPVQLYPIQPRFFHAKKPLLERLPPRYRKEILSLDMRLGPGWSKPPRGQHTLPKLGLADCTSVKVLRIMVEIDPSNDWFAGFRGKDATEDTYKWFCVDLLRGIIEQVPSLAIVEIDANPGVKKDAPLILALQRTITQAGKKLAWGPLRQWDKDMDEPGLIGLESAMDSLRIMDSSDTVSRQVQVEA